jgi:DNA-binding winged helix-turn-helix (wHTH) protein/tetratricopeptide (TPR) repeat protein
MQDDASAREYHSGDCVILPATRRLVREGAEVELEGKVFDLILLLVRDHARALGKQELIEKLWGRRPITDAALSQLIYKARRACGDDGERQSVIRTIYGRGLQWVAPVREIVVEPPAPAASPVSGDPSVRIPAAGTAAPGTRRRFARSVAAAIALFAICVALAWWLVPRGVAHDSAGLPRVALLPIENATGQSSLDWTQRGVPGLIGSLLASSRGIDVVDPLQVARVWNFTVPPGSSRIEHTRKVVGASILVTGRLRKLGSVYELSLHVERDDGHRNADIALAGSEPGALAVSAVARLREALDLSPQSTPALAASPVDPYLAQTFARGMDAGMHGRWSDAKPYFTLCVREAPGFLPCRLRLGQAQANTDQLAESGKTLEALLAVARHRDDTGMIADTLFELGDVSLIRHEHATALKRLQEAAVLARTLGDPTLRTRIALKSVDVASRLKRFDLADRQLQLARDLIQQHALEASKPDLHTSESFLASARGDYPAAEKADREALAASTALGNEANAAGDAYNLGLDLLRQKKTADALPLLAYTYRMGGKLQNTRLEFSGGDNLAILLLNAGVEEQVAPIAERLLEIGRQQKNPVWQALALILRGGSEWNAGDRKAALASVRQSAALVDPAQDPDLWIALQYNVAMAMVFEDPASLPALSKQVDAVIAKQPKPDHYRYSRSLIRAMAAATSDQAAAVRDLEAAAAAAHPDDPTHGNLHRAALVVALATGDADAARVGLPDFDPSASHDADILLLASQWARRQGDAALAAKAGQRLKALRETALAALRKSGPDAIADISGDSGD